MIYQLRTYTVNKGMMDDARSHLARIHVEPMESVLKVPASR